MNEAVGEFVSLSTLQPGERGKITSIELDGAMKGRIMEMGLTIGATVEFVRTAPLGDPIAIKVRGSQISIRKSEAAAIKISRL